MSDLVMSKTRKQWNGNASSCGEEESLRSKSLVARQRRNINLRQVSGYLSGSSSFVADNNQPFSTPTYRSSDARRRY